MKRRLFIAGCMFAVCAGTCLYYNTRHYNQEPNALVALNAHNIEALSVGDDGYYRVAHRTPLQCTIQVGAYGKIKLFGGSILKANADGIITFDGQVVCAGNGDVLCRPVECIDLYKTIN